jgi:hypothetical protein
MEHHPTFSLAHVDQLGLNCDGEISPWVQQSVYVKNVWI